MLTANELKALPRPDHVPVSSNQIRANALAMKWFVDGRSETNPFQYIHTPVALTDNSVMIPSHGLVEKTFGLNVVMRNMLSIRIALDGDFIFQLQGQPIEQYEGARVSLLHFADKQSFYSWYIANCRYQMIHIGIPYQDLKTLFNIDLTKLDKHVAEFFKGTADQPLFQSFPLNANFSELAREIIQCPYSDELAKVYLKAKGMEILCAIIEMLYRKTELSLSAKTREENQLILAKQILQKEFLSPPTIEQVAKRVGVSRARLTRRFREKYDCSLMKYAQSLRFNQAKQMLKSGKFSVTETALELGYQSASNFARAYQKFLGNLPKQDKAVSS